MKKFFRYNNFLYIAVHIFIGLDLFNRTKENLNSLLIFMTIFLIVIINNYMRSKYFYQDHRKLFLSMFIYIILSGVLIYNISGYTSIFSFMILYELIIFTKWRRSGIFIALTIFNITFLSILRLSSLKEILSQAFWQENSIDIAMMFLYIAFYLFALVGYSELRIEKAKVDKLNRELELSYNKLIKQSEEIEKLTITRERNRVAGEIHDSLGHSLIALNMNLDVANKIIDKDIIKTKELINKSKILSKESMENLRRAVYALKEDSHVLLKEKIEEIIENLQSTGIVKIELNLDEEIESLPMEYKNIIYTSIKELITNSIKHGKAEMINIDIKVENNNINISVKDNGLGCSNLVKGNGLMGIENRLNGISGKINYDSMDDQGFSIEIII